MLQIQQQMYTRERAGIFTTTPGYDTIAKSKGLDNNFIKKVIHPLCSYYPPRELSNSGERDEGKYPKSKLIMVTETGELIFGQSVYKESDYTGERETFFSHNMIVPKERAKEYLYSADTVFGSLPFRTGYELANGSELEELDHLPFIKGNIKPLKAVLNDNNIPTDQFMQLVFALLSSLTSKKKVYVSLPGDIAAVSESAFDLTYYLFQCIPFELRRYFGFISYAAEPQSKKNINLMFVEKGSIRPNDSLISKDYVFDFAFNHFINANENLNHQPFIEFVYRNLQHAPSKLADFYTFAKTALCDQKSPSLQSYNDLIALYAIKEGTYSHSNNKQSSLYKSFRSFLTSDNITQKTELYHVLVKLVKDDAAKISKSELPEDETIVEILQLASLFAQQDLGEIYKYLIRALYHGANDSNYLNHVYKHLKGNPLLFKNVNAAILKNPKLVPVILEAYVKMSLNRMTTLKEVIGEIKFWLDQYPEVFDNQVINGLTKERLIIVFQQERNRLRAFYEVQKNLNGTRSLADSIQWFKKNMMTELSIEVMRGLKIELLSPEEFDQAAVIANHIPKECMTAEIKQKVELIHLVHDIMEKRYFSNPERYFNYSHFGKLQAIVIKLMPTSHLEEKTDRIALCFYNKGHGKDTFYRYDEMFSFVDSNGGLEEMRGFLQRFIRMRGTSQVNDPAFKNSVQRYMSTHAKVIFGDKRIEKRWEAIHPMIKKTMEEVKLQQLSALGKFVYKNKKTVVSSLIVIMSLVILGGASGLIYKQIQEEKAAEALAAQQKKEEAERKRIAEEKAKAERAEAERIAKTMTLQATGITYKDVNNDGEISNSDEIIIVVSNEIDMTKLSILEHLEIYYKEEKIEVKNISEADIVVEPNAEIVNVKISDNNLAAISPIAVKAIGEANEQNESSDI
ncbi:GAP1-N2 domain-containing protein [Cytobacillus massiliigabonensis]|uniref:GAP1-N2 domain-containing protein n=1 Tax=Cytobacillus massiliigabonensis TaxID=1871011 RepID=UPI000C82C2A7|nr:hypothetical protein [Cytobacillus massiliigabonensis]